MKALRKGSQDDAQVSLGKRSLKTAEQPSKKKLQTLSACSNLGPGLEISAPAQDETTESKSQNLKTNYQRPGILSTLIWEKNSENVG